MERKRIVEITVKAEIGLPENKMVTVEVDTEVLEVVLSLLRKCTTFLRNKGGS